MHPVPIVHGMTIGEYAQMINGEGWLANGIKCELTVIPMKNYNHQTSYNLPIKPSPNLPNAKAINLYPSLCFFEGTNVSVGRGTDKQFQIYGSPFLPKGDLSFTPHPNIGSKHPKHEGNVCHGFDLTHAETLNSIHLDYLIDAYINTDNKSEFFNTIIDLSNSLLNITKPNEGDVYYIYQSATPNLQHCLQRFKDKKIK